VGDLRVGVLGASSLVGRCALPILRAAGFEVTAYTRNESLIGRADINWRLLSGNSADLPAQDDRASIPYWLSLAPIWVLPEHFSRIERTGARRVVALSSTSRFTKADSQDAAESAVAAKLIEGETRLQSWAESRGMDWVILRPTLIYGLGQDKNITEIARFARRFGFFPLLGRAQGLRQPVHAEDVASACVAALQLNETAGQSYNLSGGETLSYREMVSRIFAALGQPARLATVPLWSFRLALAALRWMPRFRQWSPAMAERMNRDLVFDHSAAARDLGFSPRLFTLSVADLPPSGRKASTP